MFVKVLGIILILRIVSYSKEAKLWRMALCVCKFLCTSSDEPYWN